MTGMDVAERARSLVGTRFRPQGRTEGLGLDCVGTVAAATGTDPAKVRRDYRLRGERLEQVEEDLLGLGFVPVPQDWALSGDIIVMQTGKSQLHLGVLTKEGFVHADAGLGQVVERPGSPPWPVIGAWRVHGHQAGEAR